MTAQSWFVDVILPLPLKDLYTYSVDEQQYRLISPGCRVIVQFGSRKYYTALVKNIHNTKPAKYRVKAIFSVLDNKPVVNTYQFSFWEWIAAYYMCSMGEVFKSALPSSLKPESETRVISGWDEEKELTLSTEEEFVFTAILKNNGMSLKQVELLTGRKRLMPVINSLVEKGVVEMEELLMEKYKPKTKLFVRLRDLYKNKKELNKQIDKLEKYPRQSHLLLSYLSFSQTDSSKSIQDVEKAVLLKHARVSDSVLNSLIKKNILEVFQKEVGRTTTLKYEQGKINLLTDAQYTALWDIVEKFSEKEVVLLHGVTASGKTEIYIHLIEEQLKQGKQVLYLLPEIALTSQIIKRLKSVFGNRVGVYHSRFSNAERVEVYQNIAGLLRQDEIRYQVIVGVRSSVFLPFDNLGLVIVDEEHDSSYKQADPAPRYHARDAVIMLAKIHQAKVLLGSATPSIESYYNTITGKYHRTLLTERYLKIEMPETEVVDLIRTAKKKQMQSHFSALLIQAITHALDENEQVILFQNRRGFSTYLACSQCGWIPMCKHCDVSLTYHKQSNRLVCHYCGYTSGNLTTCSSCGNSALLARGFGTEKVEDEIQILFPGAHVARLDIDNARTKNSYTAILDDFESGKINILVGTQMISKGLDFKNVRVVGILNADNMLNYPDFRSYERSFQLMAQVGGRAGRSNGRGKVILQTYDPHNPIIKCIVSYDYKKMFEDQVHERREFRYPPFCRLVNIILKHKETAQLDHAADEIARILKNNFTGRVIGPQTPVISKIQDFQIKNILVRFDKDHLLNEHKTRLRNILDVFISDHRYPGLQVNIDVDPV